MANKDDQMTAQPDTHPMVASLMLSAGKLTPST
jgi:hypothetical protein